MQTPTRPSGISRRVVSTPTRNGVSPSTSGPTLLSQSVRSAGPPTSRIGRSVTSSGLNMLSTPKRITGNGNLGDASNQSILEEDTAEDLAYQRERRALANQIKNLQRMLREEKERADGEAKDRRELEILVESTQRENMKCLEEKAMWQDYSKKIIAEGAKQLGPNWIADSDLAQLPSIASTSRRIPLAATTQPKGSKTNRRQSWYGMQMGTPGGEISEEADAGKEEKVEAKVVGTKSAITDEENQPEQQAAEPDTTLNIITQLRPALLTLLDTSTSQQTGLIRDLIATAETTRHETEENENTLRALRESRERDERARAMAFIEAQRAALAEDSKRLELAWEQRERWIKESLATLRERTMSWHDKHDTLQTQIGTA